MVDLTSLKGIIAMLVSVVHSFKVDEEESGGLLPPDLHKEASPV